MYVSFKWLAESRIADGLQPTSQVVINMSLAPLRLGLANRRVPFAHQSDQRDTPTRLGDLRESLLLRLLRWIGDMVTGQLIMSTIMMHWPQWDTATGNCPTPWRSGQWYETDLTKPYHDSVANQRADCRRPRPGPPTSAGLFRHTCASSHRFNCKKCGNRRDKISVRFQFKC